MTGIAFIAHAKGYKLQSLEHTEVKQGSQRRIILSHIMKMTVYIGSLMFVQGCEHAKWSYQHRHQHGLSTLTCS